MLIVVFVSDGVECGETALAFCGTSGNTGFRVDIRSSDEFGKC